MVGVGGVIVVIGLYLVITALLARSQLNTVRADLGKLRSEIGSGDLPGARDTAGDVASHAHTAHELTSGPVWAAAAALPSGGEPLETIRGLTANVDNVGATVIPQLVSVSEQLDPTTLRRPNGSINLAPIAAVTPALGKATASLSASITSIRGLPTDTWLSSIDGARGDVLDRLESFGQTIHSADLAARIAPTMLGQSGVKTYMLAFQTEAELRGTGGLPGAFAIVKADHGKISFVRFENDLTLKGVKTGLDFGSDYDHLYAGANATDEYADSNVSPHFPYAAQIWTAMWRKYSGQQLDGAMAVDPTALSYLLRVTGPVTTPNGTRVTTGNVVKLTQQGVYAKFKATDSQGRRSYQLGIAKAISTHLLQTTSNTTGLIRAAARASGEHRLLLWSRDPTIEADLSQTLLGGVVRQTSQPYIGLSVNNAAANKLDTYTEASLSWRRTGCGTTRDVAVTITVRNAAPQGLPTYVYGRTGHRGYPARPGDNRSLVGYFATAGAQLRRATLDGKPATSQIGAERGHPVFTTDLSLPRGQTRTIVLYLTEPAGMSAPIVRAQPLVKPLKVSVEDANCG